LFLGEASLGNILKSVSEPVLKPAPETGLVPVSELLGLFYSEQGLSVILPVWF